MVGKDNLLEVICKLQGPEDGCSWDVQEELDRLLVPAELSGAEIKH